MDDLVVEMLEKIGDIIQLLQEQPNESYAVAEELAYQLQEELESLLAE